MDSPQTQIHWAGYAKRKPKILVVGSMNMDLVISCEKLPIPGETRMAHQSQEIPGGKGANQAVAASRAGGAVQMIGRVGDDAFGPRLLENLRREHVDVNLVKKTKHCASGIAMVAVEDQGENMILVVPGSNGRLDREDVLAASNQFQECDLLLLQLEIPIDTVRAAIQLAHQSHRRVLLNPAPFHVDFDDSLLQVDVVCPNQSEASAILQRPIESRDQATEGALELRKRGAKNVVITLGGNGAVLADEHGTAWIEPFAVEAVDTTAAGDAFCGAFAVRWSEGASFREAVRYGCAAGAFAATRKGAQPSLPTRTEIDRMMS